MDEETAEARYLNELKEKKVELESKKRITLLELKASISLLEKYVELVEEGLDVKDKIKDTGQDIVKWLDIEGRYEDDSIWNIENQIRETMQDMRRMEKCFLAQEKAKGKK